MDLQPIIEAARENIRTVMERDGVPGVSVALIDNGQPVWAESFGLTDVGDKGRPIAPDTIFSLQSISKNFTATAVMLAVQRGLLDLDRPIIDYLPDFTVHSRHERDPQSRMTLRHLLSHRAGFTHEAPIGGNWEPTFATYDGRWISTRTSPASPTPGCATRSGTAMPIPTSASTWPGKILARVSWNLVRDRFEDRWSSFQARYDTQHSRSGHLCG